MTTALATVRNAIAVPEIDSEEFRSTVVEMAECFAASIEKMRLHLEAIKTTAAEMNRTFKDANSYRTFDLTLEYNRDSVTPEKLVNLWTREAWKCIVNKLHIRDLMGVKRREEFDKQLDSGELPPINAKTIYDVILGLVGQAEDFARDAVREVFDYLRPWNNSYKTNKKFYVGKRVIMTYQVAVGYDRRWKVQYNREQRLTALDNVFHVLDGKGIIRDGRPPIINAINAMETSGNLGETEYFRFRCYRNGNLHLEFKRLDLVKQLNQVATGDNVIGDGE